MLTTNQKKIIKSLTSEFEENNLKNQVRSEGTSLFDKAFENNLKHTLALRNWYSCVETNNAEIKARGQEMLYAMTDKLKDLFFNYNLDINKEVNHIVFRIVLPSGLLKETFVTIFLSTYIAQHTAYFEKDKGNQNSIDKGITILSHAKLNYYNKDIDIDTFENSSVFKEMIDNLLKEYGHLITKK
jgi:hypothetical protein